MDIICTSISKVGVKEGVVKVDGMQTVLGVGKCFKSIEEPVEIAYHGQS